MTKRLDRQGVGQRGERLAEAHLTARGMTTLARNYRTRGGEVDLVMRDGESLVFVEVRVRRHHDYGGALGSVDSPKQRRLAHAAAQYLVAATTGDPPPCRFDVIAIDPGSDAVEWVTNAFEVDSWI